MVDGESWQVTGGYAFRYSTVIDGNSVAYISMGAVKVIDQDNGDSDEIAFGIYGSSNGNSIGEGVYDLSQQTETLAGSLGLAIYRNNEVQNYFSVDGTIEITHR